MNENEKFTKIAWMGGYTAAQLEEMSKMTEAVNESIRRMLSKVVSQSSLLPYEEAKEDFPL